MSSSAGARNVEAVARALVARRATGDDLDRHVQSRPAPRGASVSSIQSGMRDDDDPVDAGLDDRAQAAQEDRLAGQPDELLGHLRREPVTAATGQEDRVDPHAAQHILDRRRVAVDAGGPYDSRDPDRRSEPPGSMRRRREPGDGGRTADARGPDGAVSTWRLKLRIAIVRLGFRLGRRGPVRRQIVLATSHERSLRGNLALLRDRLAADHRDVPVVVDARRMAGGGLGLLRAARDAFRSGRLVASSAVIVVDDYFLPLYVVEPRPETTIVQVWHACGAFKKFGYSVVDKRFGADPDLLARVRIHANYDVCLVSSMQVAPAYAEAFDQPLERFRSDLGIPRTDVLVPGPGTPAMIAGLRRRYAIPADKRVILYAPTFRGASITRARADGLPDWNQLRDALADTHVLLVRLHPFVREGLVIDRELDGFVTDVSDHPDINELLHVTDVLVTDYSSVVFEFALLHRPMVFFAPDLADYEGERGFYLDYRTDLPGPVTETTADAGGGAP